MKGVIVKDKILKQDIIIPAGTRFSQAPARREYFNDNYEITIGLTSDSSGTFTYCIDPGDPKLSEFFEDADE